MTAPHVATNLSLSGPPSYSGICHEHGWESAEAETESGAQGLLDYHLANAHQTPKPPRLEDPTQVNVTTAAAWLMTLHDDPLLRDHYRGALGMFAEMTGLTDAEALAYATDLTARCQRDVIAHIVPVPF